MPAKKIISLSAAPEGFGQNPDELTADMFVSKLPVQHSHEYYADEELGLYVGVWDTTDMTETAGPYACDEFMYLLEGEAVIKNCKTGVKEKAKAGEAFLIPRGYDCQWHQSGYLRKYYLISENPNEPVPEKPTVEGIIIPSDDAPMKPLDGEAPFWIENGNPLQKQHVCYPDTTGKFLSGTWESEPFESETRPFPYNEFAYVRSGSLTVVDESGGSFNFKSGDALFLPEGVVCRVEVTEKVRLFFAVLRTVKIA
jgi:uncharacterized cupin superfamily protein